MDLQFKCRVNEMLRYIYNLIIIICIKIWWRYFIGDKFCKRAGLIFTIILFVNTNDEWSPPFYYQNIYND